MGDNGTVWLNTGREITGTVWLNTGREITGQSGCYLFSPVLYRVHRLGFPLIPHSTAVTQLPSLYRHCFMVTFCILLIQGNLLISDKGNMLYDSVKFTFYILLHKFPHEGNVLYACNYMPEAVALPEFRYRRVGRRCPTHPVTKQLAEGRCHIAGGRGRD